MTATEIKIEVIRDYDGYFENLVRGWLKRVENPKHHTIRINSGPWRPYAVDLNSIDGILIFDFYSALRAGFGLLDDSEIDQIIAKI